MSLICVINELFACFQEDGRIIIRALPAMIPVTQFNYSRPVTHFNMCSDGRIIVNDRVFTFADGAYIQRPLKWYEFRGFNDMKPKRIDVYIRSMKALRADFTLFGEVNQLGSYKIIGETRPSEVTIRVMNRPKCGYTPYSGGEDGLFKAICQDNARRLVRDGDCFKRHTYREYEIWGLLETYKECAECGTNTVENYEACGLGRLLECRRAPLCRILIMKFDRGYIVYDRASESGLTTTEPPCVYAGNIVYEGNWRRFDDVI